MSAGTFRHRIQVQTPVAVDDGEGGQTVTWEDGVALWADVQSVTANEQAIAGAVQTLGTHRVMTYFLSSLTTEQRFARLAPSGPTLQILGIRDVDGRQRWMDVDCAEVVAN